MGRVLKNISNVYVVINKEISPAPLPLVLMLVRTPKKNLSLSQLSLKIYS
jgi:hypothetical protein